MTIFTLLQPVLEIWTLRKTTEGHCMRKSCFGTIAVSSIVVLTMAHQLTIIIPRSH